MKKVTAVILVIFILSVLLTSCSQEPWVDMTETLMRGEYDRANKQYEKIKRDPVKALKTSDYVYEYIENMVIFFKEERASYETVQKKLNLFSLSDFPVYNIDEAKEQVEMLHASRVAFEEAKALYQNESFKQAVTLFATVNREDTKYFDRAQEYLLSIVHYFLYNGKYSDAKDAILSVDINQNTISKLAEYSIELVVRFLYYDDDIDSADTVNEGLLKTIVLVDSSTGELLKEWADKFQNTYSRPEYAAVCISYLSKDVADTFYKFDKIDGYLNSKKPDYAFIILKSIQTGTDTVGYIAPRLTEILSQYIQAGRADYAQTTVDAIFSNIEDKQMAYSLVEYVRNNIKNKEYLSKIDMTIR